MRSFSRMATEVVHEEHIEHHHFHGGARRLLSFVARVIDFLFGLLYALLLVRFALVFFAARPDVGFFQLIHQLTEPFYAPFEHLFATTQWGGFRLEWPLLVAIVVYGLLQATRRGARSA